MVMWWGLISTQRQAQKMISDSTLTAKNRILSFNRTQSRVVTCLLTGHNTLRSHLYLMGLTNSYAGGLEQRNKPHPTFCASVKLWLHSDKHIWALFFLNSEDVWGQSGTLVKRQGSHYLASDYGAQRAV